MARQARGGIAAVPHLLTQRTHEGQVLFRDEQDRQHLLDALRLAARNQRVAVHAYAVDAHNLWMLATPSHEHGLSLMVQAIGRQYVAYFNRRHDRQGALWSGRYRCCVVASDQDLLDCMVVVETMGGERVLGADVLSSAGHHLGNQVDPLITEHAQFWTLGNTPFEREAAWKVRLAEGLNKDRLQQIRYAVHSGWALGQFDDIARLQQVVSRRLTPGQRGRPARKPAEASSLNK